MRAAHRVALDQLAVAGRVVENVVGIGPVHVVAGVQDQLTAEHVDRVADLDAVPVHRRRDPLRERVLERRIEDHARGIGVALLALQVRVALEREDAAQRDEGVGIGMKVRRVGAAPEVDLLRAQRLEFRAIRVARRVRLRQRRGHVGGARVAADAGELRAHRSRRVQLGDVGRALGAVVTAAHPQPLQRLPAQLRLVGGHVLPGGVLRVASTQLEIEAADAGQILQHRDQQLGVDLLHRHGPVDETDAELPGGSVGDVVALAQRIGGERVRVLAPAQAHRRAHFAGRQRRRGRPAGSTGPRTASSTGDRSGWS